MWDDLSAGALGAVVLVDSRRLADCFYAIDYFESKDIPFVIAVNQFDGASSHELEEIRGALQLDPEVLVTYCDARERNSVKSVLLTLFEVILTRMQSRQNASSSS